MKALYLFSFFVIGLYSCDLTASENTPDRVDEIADSLWSIYGKEIKIAKPEYLRVLGTVPNGYTVLYGGRGMEFWLGVFSPDRTLIEEHLLETDASSKITNPVTRTNGITYSLRDYWVFELYTESKNTDATHMIRSIVALDLQSYTIGIVHDLLAKDELDLLEFVRPWRGSFLLEHTGIISNKGKSFTQAISYDFKERTRWECRTPESPRIGVYYFELDVFVDIHTNGLYGFDYSQCRSWAYNTLDFFGLNSCPGCQTSIKLKNQIGTEITLEAGLNGEVRRIVMEYRTGRIISNTLNI